VRRDADAIARYVESRDALEQERRVLVAQREEVNRWAEEERARQDRLVTVRRRQQSLLEEASEERRELARQARELETKERRLTDLIRALAEAADTALDGRPIQQFEGVLDWPLEGEVTAGFGPRLDPRYGTKVPHNGIEIAVPGSHPAAAVYPGKVLFAAPLEGYGPTVVMLHPGRVFTLYAGLASLRVSSEDVLSLGDVVGTSTDRLYFEIRVENRPQDPLQWLR
jgi:murein DD-endopeptidase MepM/ murein hydrolase activator NlpD